MDPDRKSSRLRYTVEDFKKAKGRISVVNFYLANGPKYVGKKSLEVRNGSRASVLGRNGR